MILYGAEHVHFLVFMNSATKLWDPHRALQYLGFRVQGFRVLGLGVGVWGFGFRV